LPWPWFARHSSFQSLNMRPKSRKFFRSRWSPRICPSFWPIAAQRRRNPVDTPFDLRREDDAPDSVVLASARRASSPVHPVRARPTRTRSIPVDAAALQSTIPSSLCPPRPPSTTPGRTTGSRRTARSTRISPKNFPGGLGSPTPPFPGEIDHLSGVPQRTARSTPLFMGVVLNMRITAHESSPHSDVRLRGRFTPIAASSASRNKNAIAPASALGLGLGLGKFHDRRHEQSTGTHGTDKGCDEQESSGAVACTHAAHQSGARRSAHAAHDPGAMHLTAPRFMAAVDDITRFLSAHLPTATS
jgi:hypothetical protein